MRGNNFGGNISAKGINFKKCSHNKVVTVKSLNYTFGVEKGEDDTHILDIRTSRSINDDLWYLHFSIYRIE